MEVPQYQSRGLGPESSGLAPANPAIVGGGGAITQGLSTAASGMLVLAAQEQQQRQLDLVSDAAMIFGQVSNEIDTYFQGAIERQRIEGSDPMSVLADGRQHVQEIQDKVFARADVQHNPKMAKYLATHLPATIHSRLENFTHRQNEAWVRADEFRTDQAMQALATAAAADPAQSDAMRQQAVALLNTKLLAGSLKGEKASSHLAGFDHNVHYRQAFSYARSHAQEWVLATRQGQMPPGIDTSQFTPDELEKLDSIASTTFSNLATEATARETKQRQLLTEKTTLHKNEWLVRHMPHRDLAGNMVPSRPLKQILRELGTVEARAELGDQLDTVHSFYMNLEHQQATAPDKKISPQEYHEALGRIFKGEFSSPGEVLAYVAGRKFDKESTNNILAAYGSEETRLDKPTQEAISYGEKIISDRFAMAPGQQLDNAGLGQAKADSLENFYRRIYELRKETGRPLRREDILQLAEELSTASYLSLANSIISILPYDEKNLKYQTTEDIYTKASTGIISQGEAGTHLRQLARVQEFRAIRESAIELDRLRRKQGKQ